MGLDGKGDIAPSFIRTRVPNLAFHFAPFVQGFASSSKNESFRGALLPGPGLDQRAVLCCFSNYVAHFYARACSR